MGKKMPDRACAARTRAALLTLRAACDAHWISFTNVSAEPKGACHMVAYAVAEITALGPWTACASSAPLCMLGFCWLPAAPACGEPGLRCCHMVVQLVKASASWFRRIVSGQQQPRWVSSNMCTACSNEHCNLFQQALHESACCSSNVF